MRVAVVGGGWYGCHIASSLLALGFEVRLFEKNSRLMHEASGNNQFRLHMGFHYARHHGTRVQSRDGYLRFLERYSALSEKIEQNIYAVPLTNSLIDWNTYKLIMTSTGLDYREIDHEGIGLENINGAMIVDERVLMIERSRRYFMRLLGGNLVLDHSVSSIAPNRTKVEVDGDLYDYVVDATWGHHSKLPIKTYYEPTILLYYEAREDMPAVTFVDGPLCSVYPTEDRKIYTLSSVKFTPLGRTDSSNEARRILNLINAEIVSHKVADMEEQISEYMGDFRQKYKFMGPQLAIKTKPIGLFDDRSCGVYRDGNIFRVMSGKIDTIFFALERILAFMQEGNSPPADREDYVLRKDILMRVEE